MHSAQSQLFYRRRNASETLETRLRYGGGSSGPRFAEMSNQRADLLPEVIGRTDRTRADSGAHNRTAFRAANAAPLKESRPAYLCVFEGRASFLSKNLRLFLSNQIST